MGKLIILYLSLLCLIYVCNSELKPTTYQVGSIIGLTTDETITVLTQQQSDMYEKCLSHLLKEFRNELQKQGFSRQQINKRIYQKVVSIHRLWIELKNYMVNKLFNKFEMNELSDDFQRQIKQYPGDYFLTFEMYDLLFD